MYRFLIVNFVHKTPEDGFLFDGSSWPLHMTLVPPFSVPTDTIEVLAEIERNLTNFQPFSTSVGADAAFGRRRTVPVSLINSTPQLQRLHEMLLKSVTELGGEVVTPIYSGKGYKSHVTFQKSGRLQPGQKIDINNVSLVDRRPDDHPHQRQVIRTLLING